MIRVIGANPIDNVVRVKRSRHPHYSAGEKSIAAREFLINEATKKVFRVKGDNAGVAKAQMCYNKEN